MSGNSSTDIWIAGAFAAFTVDLLVFPLDTIKTRIQSPDYKRLYTNEATKAVNKAALFRGLYQGIGSVILATLPASGAFFTTYEASKSGLAWLNPSNPLSDGNGGFIPTPIIHSAASGIAECVSCAILTPAEVIKQNAQMVSNTSGASATAQTLRKFKTNPFALWRGYGALTGRNLPNTAIQFPLFERFKDELWQWRGRSRAEVEKIQRESEGDTVARSEVPLLEVGAVTAAAAGSAGAIAAVITTPIDVIKTRIMLAAATSFAKQDKGSKAVESMKEGKVVDALGAVAKSGDEASKPQKRSSWAIGKEIVRDQGWKGLWRGGALRGAWTMLGAGLYLGVYESARIYLKRRSSAE